MNLNRISDGAGDNGKMVNLVNWEKGIGHIVPNNSGRPAEPLVGCGIAVGSAIARSYSSQDYWMTTPVTEILYAEKYLDGTQFWLFRTKNSVYEMYDCSNHTLKQMREKLKDYYVDELL